MNRLPRRRGNWSVQELERLRFLLPRRGVADTAVLLRRSADSVRRKAIQLFARTNKSTEWDAEDDAMLRQSWGAVDPRLLSVILDRPVPEILHRVANQRTDLRVGDWTRDELRQLKELYGTRTDEDLEVCLSRGRGDIREMAGRLCLSKDKRFTKQRMGVKTERGMRMPRWTAAEITRLRELYCGSDNLAVARELGRSVASVANKANQLGLRKDPQLLAQIGRKNVALRYLSVEDD